MIQQIKIGNQTWLFYRQFESRENGGKVSASFRIAELPGKVLDLKVETNQPNWHLPQDSAAGVTDHRDRFVVATELSSQRQHRCEHDIAPQLAALNFGGR